MARSTDTSLATKRSGDFWSRLALKPHRATLINVGLLTILLAGLGSGTVFTVLGVGALVIAALYSLFRAVPLTLKHLRGLHPFQFSLIWSPGALSLALASGALYVAKHQPPFSVIYFAAIAFYGVQLAWLVITSAELKSQQSSLNTLLGND